MLSTGSVCVSVYLGLGCAVQYLLTFLPPLPPPPSSPHSQIGAVTSDSDDEFTFYSYSDEEGEDGMESASAVDHYESLVSQALLLKTLRL